LASFHYTHFFSSHSYTNFVEFVRIHVFDYGYSKQTIIMALDHVGDLYYETTPGTWLSTGFPAYKYNAQSSSNNTQTGFTYVNQLYEDDTITNLPIINSALYGRNDRQTGDEYWSTTALIRDKTRRYGINLPSIPVPTINIIFDAFDNTVATIATRQSYRIFGRSNLTQTRPASEGGQSAGGSEPIPNPGDQTFPVYLLPTSDSGFQLSDSDVTQAQASFRGWTIDTGKAYVFF
jgi:hypothetical protein